MYKNIKIGTPIIISNDLSYTSYTKDDLIPGDEGIIIHDIHNEMNFSSTPHRYKLYYVLIKKNKKKYWIPTTDIEIDFLKIRREKLNILLELK